MRKAEKIARGASPGARVAFLGHAVIWGATCGFIFIVSTLYAAIIVGAAWGIGLTAHGFFAVAGPELRKRWASEEVDRQLGARVNDARLAQRGEDARSLERLSAAVAHEIRNPITAAKSLLQQIAEDPTSDDNAEFGRIAAEELDRVERAVSHLLRYAREEQLRFREIRLEDVVRSALESLRDRLAISPVEVRTDLDGGGELRADPEQLRRVVANLVGNAMDSLEDIGLTSPTVDISIGENLAGTEAWLRVRDNGLGVPETERDLIFTPFHTTKDEGTGLGLALSRKVVQAHGGRLELNPDCVEGAEFVITLPKQAAGGRAA